MYVLSAQGRSNPLGVSASTQTCHCSLRGLECSHLSQRTKFCSTSHYHLCPCGSFRFHGDVSTRLHYCLINHSYQSLASRHRTALGTAVAVRCDASARYSYLCTYQPQRTLHLDDRSLVITTRINPQLSIRLSHTAENCRDTTKCEVLQA
jgi:hypothetical protein